MKPDFSYQWQKLSEAVQTLMAPHPDGEDQDFGYARHYCSLGFQDFKEEQVTDPDARRWIRTVKDSLAFTGVMDFEQKHAFSRAVYALASWFRRQLDESERDPGG